MTIIVLGVQQLMLWIHLSFPLLTIAKIQLRIRTGKKHPKIKLQHLQKIRIWTFGSLLHQINSF